MFFIVLLSKFQLLYFKIIFTSHVSCYPLQKIDKYLDSSGTLQGTFKKFGTKIRRFRNPTRYFSKNLVPIWVDPEPYKVLFKKIWYQNQGSPEPYKVLFQKNPVSKSTL